MIKCQQLIKAVHEATLKGRLIEAKNLAWDLSIAANELDKAFDRHIVIHEPDGSYTVNAEQNVN